MNEVESNDNEMKSEPGQEARELTTVGGKRLRKE